MERSATNWQKLTLTGGAIYGHFCHFREFEAERSSGLKCNKKKCYRTSKGLSFDVLGTSNLLNLTSQNLQLCTDFVKKLN